VLAMFLNVLTYASIVSPGFCCLFQTEEYVGLGFSVFVTVGSGDENIFTFELTPVFSDVAVEDERISYCLLWTVQALRTSHF
ncbi:hypothetical protein GOODEAATRI_026282, partial [Goodea atripinnis]